MARSAELARNSEASDGSRTVFAFYRIWHAGYGKMEVLHGVELKVERSPGLCVLSARTALGKSTVLNAVSGLAEIFRGRITLAGRDIADFRADQLAAKFKIGYVLQSNAVFAAMTVHENLLVGAHLLLPTRRQAAEAIERIFERHPRLRQRHDLLCGRAVRW